jgi:hypothetical protein
MLAERIARPVLERAGDGPTEGVVRGVGRTTAYLDFDGFVVAVGGRRTVLMPNGIQFGFDGWRGPAPGATVVLSPGRIASSAGTVTWSIGLIGVWEPRLAVLHSSLVECGAEMLQACGIDPSGARASESIGIGCRDGFERLLGAVSSRDPSDAAAAADSLIGRGPGLTPEGDDLVAATAAVVAAFAATAGWAADLVEAWLVAIAPADLRARTSSLSATLIECAVRGEVLEPLHHVFGASSGRQRRAASCRLRELGNSTGLAYVAAAGAAALLCGRPITTTKETHARC